jgi:hypothetical protein
LRRTLARQLWNLELDSSSGESRRADSPDGVVEVPTRHGPCNHGSMTDERTEMDQAGYTLGPIPDGEAAAAPTPAAPVTGDAPLWRILPGLMLIAAWGPALAAAILTISQPGYQAPKVLTGGNLEQGLLSWIGPAGPLLFAPLIGLVTAAGIWMLSRALGAPRWAAAVVSSLSVLMPLIGLAPSPVDLPDDAAFGAAMTVAMALTMRSVKNLETNALAMAFVVAIIAAWLRPWAAWPAIAVLLAVICVTRMFEERPWCGAVAALCWGPGLFLAQLFGETDGFRGGIFSQANDNAERLGVGLSTTIAAGDQTPDIMAAILPFLATATPLVVLALAGALGLLLVWLTGGRNKAAAVSAGIFFVICVVGALGYGSADAARLLLDPILLAATGIIGLIAPEAISRIRKARAAA